MKQFATSFILLLLLSIATNAEFEFVGDVTSHKVFDNRVEFQLTNAKFNLFIFSDDVLRFRYTNHDQFSQAPSYAVIQEQPHNTEFQFIEEEEFFSTKNRFMHKLHLSSDETIYP